MGKTISEKIIAKHAGKREVTPGEFVYVKPDLVIQYAFGGHDVFEDLESIGVRVWDPNKVVYGIDHGVPPHDLREANYNKHVREMMKEQGIKHFHDQEGITWILVTELGYARPGMLLAIGDQMSMCNGGTGAFITGGGRLGGDVLDAYATGELLLRVPESIKINVKGRLGKGVMARDVWQHTIGDIGPDGALDSVLEFTGPVVEEMSIDGRDVLCAQAIYAGADAAIVNPDQKTIDYVKEKTKEPFEVVKSDPDAEYAGVRDYDASKLEPLVAAPPLPCLTKTVAEVEGKEIDQAVIGTCHGGRLEDIRAAARILKGRKVHPGVTLLVVPGTRNIFLTATKEGLIESLFQAGAQIYSSTCDICYGRWGVLADGETCIANCTANTSGRRGSAEAEIYLANPMTIAASAVEGKITDPRRFL